MPTDPVELSDDVKRFIVSELACYETPKGVCARLIEEFDIDITRQRVHRYDPTKKAGEDLSEALKVHFFKVRKAFIEETDDIPVSHKAYRLRMLQKAVEKMRDVGNFIGMADLLERAAKEMGEAYTNKHKHEHTGKDGEPLPLAAPTIVLTGAPQPASAPEAVGGIRKPGD